MLDHSGPFNIMLSASGRRVSLLRILQQSIATMGLPGEVIATDISRACPAMHAGTRTIIVPSYRDPGCLEFLLDMVARNHIRLIVPTIDTELPFYAQHADAFAARGCRINISSPEVVNIGNDKLLTHQFLVQAGIPTVRQQTLEDALASAETLELPVVIKPRCGSASIGVSVARTVEQAHARSSEKNLLVQFQAQGQEYTVDIFVDRHGECQCALPRLRLETRAGEVSRGVTARNPAVASLARKVARALPKAYGVLNIQMFYDVKTNTSAVIEINPRFGGGYPLTHEAGAPMTTWLIEDVLGLPSSASDQTWREGVVMLRYDEAFFTNVAETGLQLPKLSPH